MIRHHLKWLFPIVAILALTACNPTNTKPGSGSTTAPPATSPTKAFTPTTFCAGAKDVDEGIQTFAAIKPLSPKDQTILTDSEAILWPKNADGTPANAACNSNPMPATLDVTLTLQLIGAAVQIATIKPGN